MKRVACAWFPNWPLQRLFAVQPELNGRPVVLYAEVPRHGLRVVQASKAAFRLGVLAGLPLAEAQAILDRPRGRQNMQPHIVRHDPDADREFLAGLAEHCQRYSPIVGIDDFGPPDTLVLDITGCAEHFGGESALARQMLHDLGQFILRVAIADAIGTAWGVARFGGIQPVLRSGMEIISSADKRSVLSALPVEALRLPPNVLDSLQQLGLRNVGEIMVLPRRSLPARFGAILAQRLDEALGDIPEIIVPVRVSEPLEVDWSFETSISDRHFLETALRQLLEQLLGTLATRQTGLQRLQIRFFCAGGAACPVSLGSLRASSNLEHWQDLLHLHLERVTLPAEVLRIQMCATAVARLEVRSRELFGDGEQESERHLWELLDRLTNRLGDDAVVRAELQPDAQPEFAVRFVPLAGPHFSARPTTGADKSDAVHSTAQTRPLLLKRKPIPLAVTSVIPEGPPIRFEWDGELHTVARHWGPERVETGWWRGPHIRRDYYRIETVDGRRFWLFREVENGAWSLHGIFE